MNESNHPSSDAYFLDGEADDIGHELRLFLNRDAYADRWDVVERQNEPVKHPANPVVMPDQPWEHSVGLPNVIYDAEHSVYRMWYANYDTGKWGGGRDLEGHKRTPYMMSYAESSDGVHWTKPLLDKTPYIGFDKTNIVFTGHTMACEFHVMPTPEHLASNGRFMLWYCDTVPPSAPAVFVAYSDDGIDWRPHSTEPVYEKALDVEQCPIYDERRDLWLLYARPHALAANEQRYTGENVRTRISVTVSGDLKTWTPARQVLVPDELDRGDTDADRGYFFDRMSVIRHGNQYVGFLSVHPRHGAGRGYIELTSSADGFRWHRSVIRQPFIGSGPDGQWDAGHTWMVPTVVPVGHWLNMYYVGASRPWRTRFPDNTRAIGLVRIRKDRFVGQYADVNGGWLLSREVKITGNRLLINCSPEHRAFNQQHHGYVLVELLDRTQGVYAEQHLDGFGQDDCDPIRADEYGHVVSWKGNPDLSALAGRNVYIRFYLKSAYLFGFRFADAGPSAG